METRFNLATAIDRFLREVPLTGTGSNTNVARNRSSITRESAIGSDFFRALAEDNRFELYPDPGIPFDVDAPNVSLSFGGIHGSDGPFDPLDGNVTVLGTATDVGGSRLSSFGATITTDGAFLPDSDAAIGGISVIVGTDVLPNAVAIAGFCPNAPEAADAALANEAVCVCAVAADELENVAERILCFTRLPPAPVISQPPVNAVFAANQTVTLAGAATSGFNLTTCAASLTANPAASAPSLPSITPTGTTCGFSTSIPVASFADATWTLRLNATDIAGRSVAATRAFVTDKTPPVVAQPVLSGVDITTAAGGALFVKATSGATSTYTATTTATDSAGVSAVIFRVAPSVGAPFDVPAVRSGTSNTFTATINDVGADGQRTVVAIATDVNTNQTTSLSRAVTKDTTKPTFAWLAAGNQAS